MTRDNTLFVGASSGFRDELSRDLRSSGIEVTAVHELTKALDCIKWQDFRLVLVDSRVGRGDFANVCEFVRRAKEQRPHLRVIGILHHERSPHRTAFDAAISAKRPFPEIMLIIRSHLSVDEKTRQHLQRAVWLTTNIVEEFGKINLVPYEAMNPDDAVRRLTFDVAPVLHDLLQHARRLVTAIPRLRCRTSHTKTVYIVGDEPAAPSDSPTEGRPQPVLDTFCENFDQIGISSDKLVFLCGIAQIEMKNLSTRLKAACQKGSKWEIIAEAGETARKSQKCLRSILYLAVRLVDPAMGDDLLMSQASELQISLKVRDALCKLRNDLMRAVPEQFKTESLHEIAHRACGVLQDFFDEADYVQLRVRDRYDLRRFWSQLVQDDLGDEEVRETVKDLREYAKTLQGINERRLLLDHDRAVKQRGINALLAAKESLEKNSTEYDWAVLGAALRDLPSLGYRQNSLANLGQQSWINWKNPRKSERLGENIDGLIETLAEIRI